MLSPGCAAENASDLLGLTQWTWLRDHLSVSWVLGTSSKVIVQDSSEGSEKNEAKREMRHPMRHPGPRKDTR